MIGAVVTGDEPLWYPEDAGQLPPQIEQVLERHLDESHARQLVVLPLREAVEDANRDSAQPAIGALVCEYFTPPSGVQHAKLQTEAVAAQGTVALANALEYEGVPLVRLWRTVGQSRRLVRGRQLPKTLLALAAAASLWLPWYLSKSTSTSRRVANLCRGSVATFSQRSTASSPRFAWLTVTL